MALIKCSECGKEISDKALTCPECGSPTKKAEKDNENRGQIVAGLLIGAVVIGLFGAAGYKSFCESDERYGAKAYTNQYGVDMYFTNKYLGKWDCPRN